MIEIQHLLVRLIEILPKHQSSNQAHNTKSHQSSLRKQNNLDLILTYHPKIRPEFIYHILTDCRQDLISIDRDVLDLLGTEQLGDRAVCEATIGVHVQSRCGYVVQEAVDQAQGSVVGCEGTIDCDRQSEVIGVLFVVLKRVVVILGGLDDLGETVGQTIHTRFDIVSVGCEIAGAIVSIGNGPDLINIQVDRSQLVRNITDQLHLSIEIGDLVEIVVVHDKSDDQEETEQQSDHYVTDIVDYLHLAVLLHLDIVV